LAELFFICSQGLNEFFKNLTLKLKFKKNREKFKANNEHDVIHKKNYFKFAKFLSLGDYRSKIFTSIYEFLSRLDLTISQIKNNFFCVLKSYRCENCESKAPTKAPTKAQTEAPTKVN
jgi:hypothetical protein